MKNRRQFLKKSSIASLATLLGFRIVHFDEMPVAYRPLFSENIQTIPGKHPGLTMLNDRPVNAETPPHLLAQNPTPNDVFFIRNNGLPPVDISMNNWKLTIGGESAKQEKTYSIKELKENFENHSLQLTLECGGNGRSEYNPPAKGNQWSTGAVGCPLWTGVKLKDVLLDAGIKDDAVYIGYYGQDAHLSGDPNKRPISRGVPIKKAMEDECLIAWSMNGQDLPLMNGFPLRLVIGGWPASCSGKWLSKIVVRNQVHDGTKMGGQSYRVPCNPVAPGSKLKDEDMCIIESMPIKSLITYPKTGATVSVGDTFTIAGFAWAGDLDVQTMSISTDFGSTWRMCSLKPATNRLAWQAFEASVTLSEKGYYEVWAKATDRSGREQPMIVPGWNPKGYLNNACHRIAVRAV